MLYIQQKVKRRKIYCIHIKICNFVMWSYPLVYWCFFVWLAVHAHCVFLSLPFPHSILLKYHTFNKLIQRIYNLFICLWNCTCYWYHLLVLCEAWANEKKAHKKHFCSVDVDNKTFIPSFYSISQLSLHVCVTWWK